MSSVYVRVQYVLLADTYCRQSNKISLVYSKVWLTQLLSAAIM